MTAQILISELTTLSHDSKRKNGELKDAADKSLQDLKALANTSEAGLTADLSRRPYFVTPFLIACNTRNAKFASSGILCIQRLVIAKALPKGRIKEILDSLKECSSLGHDSQLKILQILPQLLQYYPDETSGDTFARSLQLCAVLSSSKAAALSGTALATLQQLIIAAFDRVAEEDKLEFQIPALNKVLCDDGVVIVRNGAYDAYSIFKDLCIVLQGGEALFVCFEPISRIVGLEIIESVLKNYAKLLIKHRELMQIIRSHVMKMVTNSLSDKLSFPFTMRTMRIFTIILQHFIDLLPSECEAALSLLNQVLDSEAGIAWKRILCLEVMRMVYSDPGLAFKIHAQCDESNKGKPIMRDNITVLVRIAAELSTTTGSRSQSVTSSSTITTPKIKDLGEDNGAAIANFAPIGTQPSFASMTCLEQLEKVDQPVVSEGYLYYLILTCMTGLSEAMARFILPFTVHNDSKTKKSKVKDKMAAKRVDDEYQNDEADQTQDNFQPIGSSNRHKAIPLNPLSLKAHKSYQRINTVAAFIRECWPGIMATCSTFLTASLDVDNYRALVRSMQKFAQVAGLLRLRTPRDAFLTTLGKSAVPSSVLTATLSSQTTSSLESNSGFSGNKGSQSVESPIHPNTSIAFDKKGRTSLDNSVPTLTPRNMLCLRALLNLAIALGPILQSAWSIIIEILQQSDIITAALTEKTALNNLQHSSSTISMDPSAAHALNLEIEAVQAAAYRLFESTVDFPNDAFIDVLKALFSLLRGNYPEPNNGHSSNPRRVGSISGPISSTKNDIQDYLFALGKIGDVATINFRRFTNFGPKESGWDILRSELISVTGSAAVAASARRMAAGILTRLMIDIASAARDEASDRQEVTNTQLLDTLRLTIETLNLKQKRGITMNETDSEIHITSLEALKSLLERCGDALSDGWKLVFAMISSIFYDMEDVGTILENNYTKVNSGSELNIDIISPSVCRIAFEALELLCADFLSSIPERMFTTLIDILTRFTLQNIDLNISLTSITYIWKLSDLLKRQIDASTLTQVCEEVSGTSNIRELVQNAANNNSVPASWMYLLLNLSEIVTDHRTEIRNGAVYTALRILDNHAILLSPQAWSFGIDSIFLKMIEANYEMQVASRQSVMVKNSISIKDVNETSNTILHGWSRLMGKHIDIVASGEGFQDRWDLILLKLQSFLELCDSDVNTSTLAFLVEILSRFGKTAVLEEKCVIAVRDLWARDTPKGSTSMSKNRSDHISFITYVKLWKEIYRLTRGQHDLSSLRTVTRNLQRCIEETRDLAYISDVDQMTELQSEVVSCIELMRGQKLGTEVIVDLLAHFSVLYLKRYESTHHGEKVASCVALASVCIDILKTEIIGSTEQATLFQSGIISVVLENLALNIEWKYKWLSHGKSCLWQKATLAALSILENIMPKIDRVSNTTETSIAMWKSIVRIAASIAHAQLEHVTIDNPVKDDELFDLEALARLRCLVIPRLGSANIPDKIRRDYAFGLFINSIVHKPLTNEAFESLTEPLHNLYLVRLGITIDSTPSLRMRVSYYCLSELFSLVSSVDGPPERVRLAQATAPFLILRIAQTIKTYLADQPLRGRMPQPWTQRQELIFLLQKSRLLVSENKAIPNTKVVHSRGKKHLFRLFPLLVRAIGIAEKDAQLLEEFRQTLEALEDEFNP